MKTSLKAALFFGTIPLVAGIAIFVAWVLFRAEWLMLAGVITIYAGLCAIAVGAVCLAVYLWRSWRSGTVPRWRLVWQTVAVLALFLANFIAADAAVSGAMLIEARYTVSITNHSNVPFESARIEGGGVDISLGVIVPGATVKRSFWIEHDGALFLKATQGSRKIEATIEGYVTNGVGGDMIVVLQPDGIVNVKPRRRGNLD